LAYDPINRGFLHRLDLDIGHSLVSIVVEIHSRGFPSLPNQIAQDFGNRWRRA
jgi:hypothetical protein